jgi:hypothetical protein
MDASLDFMFHLRMMLHSGYHVFTALGGVFLFAASWDWWHVSRGLVAGKPDSLDVPRLKRAARTTALAFGILVLTVVFDLLRRGF